MPDSYGGLTALARLSLWTCLALTRLPSSLASLTNLTRLSVDSCMALGASGVEGIECVGGMTGLLELELSGCNLSDVCARRLL